MLSIDLQQTIRREARAELARRYLYDYCQVRYPMFYTADRLYLRDVCDTLQSFMAQNEKRFLVMNMPPRHGKSFTAKNLTEWLFGDDPTLRIMTGSYNETLSTTFAKQVRDTIDERPTGTTRLSYRDIFSGTRVKYGEASASMWALEGSALKSYLATSPTGTATGFGANVILIDDIIKNAEEAYNELVLDKHWDWFSNTMMQRLEGSDFKVIIIMTRWATNDLAGHILQAYPDEVEHITFKAVGDDGTMLCNDILTRADYVLKTREMNRDIVEANYNQTPIDIKGRLYDKLMSYEQLPSDADELKKWNYTDTADTGKDWLCSIDYVEKDGDVYITDLVMTDEPMEVTEPKVAEMLVSDGVQEAIIESNSGGRGFARNVQRIMSDTYASNACVVTPKTQTGNKEARILSSSAWVKNHIYMPPNWHSRYPEFYAQVRAYQKKGRNLHDDAVDVLAGIYEQVTGPQKTFRMSM